MAGSAAALIILAALASPPPPSSPAPERAAPGPAILSIAELLDPASPGLAPSRRALALAGKAVRLVGFMVHTEEPSVGGFWLASRPIECDEGGAGTGDLPPDAVRVVLRANAAEPVPHLEGPLAVTGVLQVGREDVPDSGPASFRLVVERRATLAALSPGKP